MSSKRWSGRMLVDVSINLACAMVISPFFLSKSGVKRPATTVALSPISFAETLNMRAAPGAV